VSGTTAGRGVNVIVIAWQLAQGPAGQLPEAELIIVGEPAEVEEAPADCDLRDRFANLRAAKLRSHRVEPEILQVRHGTRSELRAEGGVEGALAGAHGLADGADVDRGAQVVAQDLFDFERQLMPRTRRRR
jgi:hypothetical protein